MAGDEEDVEQIKVTGNEKKDSGSLLTKILTIVFFISLFVLLLAGTATVSILMRNFMDRTLNVGTGAGGTGGSMDSNCSELTDNAKQYIGFVNSAAQKYGVDPALVAAIIQQESGWNPNAESSAGAQGMMQLMPGTAAGLGVTNSFDPEQNINGGTQYIKQQLDRFGGNIDKAIAAYNAGPGAVEQYGGVPPYKETQDYVKIVKANYEKYKECLTGGTGEGSGSISNLPSDKQELIKRILANNNISFPNGDSNLLANMDTTTLQVLLAMGESGNGNVVVTCLTEAHTTGDHIVGKGIDVMPNNNLQTWIYNSASNMNIKDLFGPDTSHWLDNGKSWSNPETSDPSLVNQHKDHIHISTF